MICSKSGICLGIVRLFFPRKLGSLMVDVEKHGTVGGEIDAGKIGEFLVGM